MIILSKKRLMLLTSMICISLTVFLASSSITNKPTVETVSLPVSNKVIVIDARSWRPR